MKRTAVALASGFLFGTGLFLSGIVNPLKVQNFLDVAGNWDPTLLFILAAAVTVTFIGYRLVLRRPHPAFDDRFHLPHTRGIDAPLLIGSALFGIGWGLGGYCPGPALTVLASGRTEAWIFVLAMTAGMLVAPRLQGVFARK